MMKSDKQKFVLLEGIEHGNRFFSLNRPGEDPTKNAIGEVVYYILGYAPTVEEAQYKLGGINLLGDSIRRNK